MKNVFSFIIALVFVVSGHSQTTYTTIQSGDYLWTSAANWDANGVPPATIGVNDIVNVNHTLYWDKGTTVSGTVNVAAGVTGYPYLVTITVNGLLNLDGYIYPDFGTVIISGSGTIKQNIANAGSSTDAAITVNGTYEYNLNGGNLEGFTMGASSILKLSGMTSDTYPGNLQAINTLEIASSSLAVDISPTATFLNYFTNITISETNSNCMKFPVGSTYTISGNLTIGANGSVVVQPTSQLTVTGTLTNNATAADLVIESNSSGTGSLIADQAVSGTFQQYLDGDRWYLITPPFNGVTIDDYYQSTGDDVYMRYYTSPGGGWTYFTELTDALSVGVGYEYWEDDVSGNGWTFNETGTFITGNQTLSMTSGGAVDADWNLVGNPYPCGLDWSQVGDRTNCDASSFYVYNGSSYKTHNGTTGTASSKVIPPFQGFFVKYGSANNIAIANDDKAHAGIELHKSAKSDFYNHFKVKATNGEQETTCVIYNQDDATNGEDPTLDAGMLFSDGEDVIEIYSLAGDRKSAINIYGEYPYSVNFGFKVPAGGGEFTIEPDDYINMDETFSIILEDLRTGDMVDFIENPSYTFTMNEGGFIEDRIVIHLNSTVGVQDIDGQSASIYSDRNIIYIKNNDSKPYDVQIMNIMGQIIYEGHSNNSGLNSISLNQPAAYYIVRLIKNEQTVVQKLYLAN